MYKKHAVGDAAIGDAVAVGDAAAVGDSWLVMYNHFASLADTLSCTLYNLPITQGR